MSESSGVKRGDKLRLGPFQFQVPDRDCQIVECSEKADGVVRYWDGDRSVSCCINCAPEFLEISGSEWTPLAGGRELGKNLIETNK